MNVNVIDEIEKIIKSLTPKKASIKGVNHSEYTFYVTWWREIDGKNKNFKPIAIQILDETIIELNNLLLDDKIKRLEEIKKHLTVKFQKFTPDFSQSTDSEHPNIMWQF